MSINSLIINTLKPTNVPVSLRNYNGKESTYITFFVEDFPELSVDDNEDTTGYFVQLDVYSESNYALLVKQVKDLLVKAGFYRISATDDPYVEGLGVYHKVMRFSYSTQN